jgi:hypothetical protein
MEFSQLVGKVFIKIAVTNDKEEMHFYTATEHFKLYHSQDCCESVWLEDITGELNDLLSSPILMAYEASNNDKITEARCNENQWFGSETWTFYHLATIKGYVTLRWIGSSNGYYSESVQLIKMEG